MQQQCWCNVKKCAENSGCFMMITPVEPLGSHFDTRTYALGYTMVQSTGGRPGGYGGPAGSRAARPQGGANGHPLHPPYRPPPPAGWSYPTAAVRLPAPCPGPQPIPAPQPMSVHNQMYGRTTHHLPNAASPTTSTGTNSSHSNSNSSTSPNSTGSSGYISSSTNGSETLSKTNLYIRGLPQSTTDKELLNLCHPYGSIISTKAILDKNTNKCKGYGFVDFESPNAAEDAVKALQDQGIQAQMAKQQEQDPTNLYIANLPLAFTESDLEKLLKQYGTVVSTRILRDNNVQSRGVGFARMESKEKCELIINNLNHKLIPGGKEPLLVKFADGGSKKRNQYKHQENRMWREGEVAVSYDPIIAQSGVSSSMLPTVGQLQRMQTPAYPAWTGMPFPYIVQPTPPVPQTVEMMPSHIDPNSMHYGAVIPQLTAQISTLQLTGTPVTGSYVPAYNMYGMGGHILQPMSAVIEAPSHDATPVAASPPAPNDPSEAYHMQAK